METTNNLLPIEIIVKLAAKTGLFFACVDGEYDASEEQFIHTYVDKLSQVGDVSEVRDMLEHATDQPITLEEVIDETRQLLNSLSTPADRQAVVWALYRFINKVVLVDGVVHPRESEAFEKWINALIA